MNKHLLKFIVVCSILFVSCSQQTRTTSPVMPDASSIGTQPDAVSLGPWVAHVVPFYSFQGGKSGAHPQTPLVEVGGSFYGTARAPGNSCTRSGGCGVVYALTRAGRETIVHQFTGVPDGSNPGSGLTLSADGALYGTTADGGTGHCKFYRKLEGCGVVYTVAKVGSRYVERVLYSFRGGRDGANPYGPVTIGDNGVLYGTTVDGGGSCTPRYAGGVGGCGTVYSLRRSGKRYAESVLYRFTGGSDAEYPQGNLIVDANGGLYGSSPAGGTGCNPSGCGTVFKLAPTASGYTESILYRFGGRATDGTFPAGQITLANDILYGTTASGGTFLRAICSMSSPYATYAGCGTIYELRLAGGISAEKTLYNFRGGRDGFAPVAGLTLSHGLLYGTTSLGGSSKCGLQSGAAVGCGTIFMIGRVQGPYSVLYRFSGANGSNPDAPLAVDHNGGLVGTATNGGAHEFGEAYALARK